MNNYLKEMNKIGAILEVNAMGNLVKNIFNIVTLLIMTFVILGFSSKVSANSLEQNTNNLDSNINTEEDVNKNEKPIYTSTTVESITSGISDETLSFTNLLLIVLISINMVLLLLSIIILMQINKKI